MVCIDDVHDGQGSDGRGDKLDLKGHNGGQGHPGGTADAGQIHNAHEEGGDVAHDHAEQQSAQLPDALGEVVQVNHHCKGQQSNTPAAHTAEPGAEGVAAGHIPHGGGIQGKTDGENHGAGYQRGEEHPDFLDKDAEENGHKTACQFRTQNGGQVKLHTDGGEGGNIGEADAHNHRQPCADAVENGEQLQQGGDRGDNQRRLNENGFICHAQVANIAAGNDNGRGNDAHHGSHHMLEAQGHQLARRRNAVVGENAGRSFGVVFHKVPASSFCVEVGLTRSRRKRPARSRCSGRPSWPGLSA